MVAGVTVLGVSLIHLLSLSNVAMLYLLPVMAASTIFGLRAGLFTGVVSSLAYNFFFLPPLYRLTISNPENILAFVILLTVAIVMSQLAARVRDQADLASHSARQNAALAGFSRQLTGMSTEEELAQAICAEVARLFDVVSVMMVPSPDGPELRAAYPPVNRLGQIELAAAQWTLDRSQPAGRGSDTLTASDWLFYPLRPGAARSPPWASPATTAAIRCARTSSRCSVSLLDQSALALDRMILEGEMRDVAQLKDRDRLRAALLSSVSHDLRTPLTAILAASAELRKEPAPDLIDTIEGEAQRLNRFVANLLDMARVEAGVMRLNIEPTDLTDAVASAVHDTRRTLEGHEIRLDVSPGLPLVRIDPQLFHHILINLLDNAGRYAEPGTPITIEGRRSTDAVTLAIRDDGPGLAPMPGRGYSRSSPRVAVATATAAAGWAWR